MYKNLGTNSTFYTHAYRNLNTVSGFLSEKLTSLIKLLDLSAFGLDWSNQNNCLACARGLTVESRP
jgi:hypothetical protein